MRVFISWSGDLSRQVGELLKDWLPSVVQAAHPYVSSQDTEKGARWSIDLSRELERCDFGILCVTGDNLGAPWLNFEAGALSKSVDRSRVTPLLIDIDQADVEEGPLLQFQSALCTEDDVRKLVHGINAACTEPLAEKRIDTVFGMWWPQLHDGLQRLRSRAPTPGKPHRPAEDMLAEIVTLVRDQHKLLTGQRLQAADTISAAAVREMAYAWAELQRAAGKLPGDERCAELRSALEEATAPLGYLLAHLGGPSIR